LTTFIGSRDNTVVEKLNGVTSHGFVSSGFYPYTYDGRSLRPVKNREKFFGGCKLKIERESFDKVADQNSPFIFTWQTTPLT